MSEKKEIIIEVSDDEKVSMTVRNICPDCLVDIMKKLSIQLIKDRDVLKEVVCTEDKEVDVDEEDKEDLLKKAPDFPEFDEAYATYKKCKRMAKDAFEEYDVKAGTIPDSFAKVMSILESDEQIRDDMFKLLSGYVTNESFIKKDSKKKKK